MIFKRIGAKKHKYQLEITLSTIKYCSWDSPYIVIMLVRGDHHAESIEYNPYKGRCNLNNQQLSVPCTMFFDDGKYLQKQAEIKIKSFSKEKKQVGATLSKIKIELVKYTQEDRPYQQTLQLDGAKLSCSIYMKMIGENTQTQETNTQASHLSHLTSKTENVAKEKNRKRDSKSKQRKTLQFGKSNRQIEDEKEADEQKQKKKRGQKRLVQNQSEIKKNRKKYSQDVNDLRLNENGLDKDLDESVTQVKRKGKLPNPNEKPKQEQLNKEIHKNVKADIEKRRQIGRQKQQQKISVRQPTQTISPVFNRGQLKVSNQKSLAKQFIYQKELQQKNQMLDRLREQNENLKQLLETRLNSQPIQTKQSFAKTSRLQEQNQKLRQKLVQKQIQLSEYEIKMKSGRQRETKLQQQTKASTAQARILRQQLQNLKNRVAEALTSALQSGDSQFLDFIQEHFSTL